MKKCFRCGQEKELDEFYKHTTMADGHLNKCKECAKEDVRQNWQRKIQNPQNIIAERERTRQKFHCLDYNEKYRVQRKLGYAEKNRKFKERFPEKYKAMDKVHYALRSGKIKREPCSICGNPKSQAHHDDYSKPLDVVWLCIKHHNERHVWLREQELLKKVV